VKPLGFNAEQLRNIQRRDNHIFQTVARLRHGVSLRQAQAKLTGIGERIARENTNRAETNWKIHGLRDFILGSALSRTVWVLFGAVMLVLMIACVNVANLLLARGSARESEIAVRNALGAGRRRIIVQFSTESLVLAALGGALGIALGYIGAAALVRYAPEGVPRLEHVAVDGSVLAFSIGLTVFTVLLFGVAPALHLMRTAPGTAVRESGRSASTGRRSTRLRSVLVVSELALAVVLLASAGLLVKSFKSLQTVQPGFGTANLLTMQVALPQSRYGGTPQVLQAFDSVIESVKQVPGVRDASGVGSLPLGGGGFYLGRVFLTTGQPEPPASRDTPALWTVIRPETLRTLDIPIVAGRDIRATDTAASNPVILINRFMARQMFGNENPIGKRIRSWRDENVYREIVGIVGDVRYGGLAEDVNSVVYVPHTQSAWRTLVLAVRTNQDPGALLRSIQRKIWSVDRFLAISDVRTMEEIVDAALARPRFSMFLLGVFALTALLMAAIGIYGLMSFAVAQQTKEIGIRMALGALSGDILRNITARAFRLALAGVSIGIMGALAVTRLFTTLLYGVTATDSETFAIAGVLLVGVAVLAAYIPARRASRLDPLTALHYE
jgi:putative ABC transport system permease protein